MEELPDPPPQRRSVARPHPPAIITSSSMYLLDADTVELKHQNIFFCIG
jgi:hypothetical protein